MNDREHLIEIVRNLLSDQKFAVLSSIDKNQPYPSLICFAEDDNLKHILFYTSINTQKFKNLQNNPKASILFDNRTEIAGTISIGIAISAFGIVEQVMNSENDEFEDLRMKFLMKYPSLEKFCDSPDSTAMNFTIQRFSVVSEFENVKNLYI